MAIREERMGQVSSRRAPADEVLRLEALYRETYRGWSGWFGNVLALAQLHYRNAGLGIFPL